MLAVAVALLSWGGRGDNAPVAAHAPHPGLDFAMEADTDGDTVNDCGTRSGGLTSCTAPLNGPFRVREYLDALGDISSFTFLQAHFGFTGGIVSKQNPDAVWPGCELESADFFPDFTHARCSTGAGDPPVSYTGLIAHMDLHCTSDGVLDLLHDTFPFHTFLTDASSEDHAEGDSTVETLDITCALPGAAPTDTDGDGCPDESEVGGDPPAGGKRNFFNRNDYFNPTGDGLNRVDDTLAVLNQYFIDDSDGTPGQPPYSPGYNPQTDRTLLGPDAWNLGPPNGLQRVDDILHSVNQYFHDCA